MSVDYKIQSETLKVTIESVEEIPAHELGAGGGKTNVAVRMWVNISDRGKDTIPRGQFRRRIDVEKMLNNVKIFTKFRRSTSIFQRILFGVEKASKIDSLDVGISTVLAG